jgi:hypothetical protein
MTEEDLELLITLDDPGEVQEEDFNHLQVENTFFDNGPYPVVFGQGEWTCTLARLTGTTNDSTRGLNTIMIQPTNQQFEIGVCIVTCSKNGEIEQKVFYDLVRMQKQIGAR